MDTVDVVIVGGSFAGLSCGLDTASRGLKTIIFDRKKSLSSYTQSTGLLVKEISEQLDLPGRLTRKIHGIRLYAPNLTHIDLHSPHYYFLATDTCHLLQHLGEKAIAAGAIIQSSTYIRNAYINQQKVFLPDQKLKTSYLVGADGAKSQLARLFNLGQNRHFLLGEEIVVEDLPGLNRDFLHVFLDKELAPGYIGWIVPGVNHVQLGLACRYPRRPQLAEFTKKLSRLFDIKNLRIIEHRGGFIPANGTVNPFAKGPVCLLGDAAGMVSPLTAGGIHPAIELGQKLGEFVYQYVVNRGPLPQLQLKKQVSQYRFKKLLRFTANHFTPPNGVLDWFLTKKNFQRFAQLVFFHHDGLFSRAAWHDLFKNKEVGSCKTDD